jgi:hypothetical protein
MVIVYAIANNYGWQNALLEPKKPAHTAIRQKYH